MEVEGSALRKRLEHQEDEMVKLHDTIEDQSASIDNLNVSSIDEKFATSLPDNRPCSGCWLRLPLASKVVENSPKLSRNSSERSAARSCSRLNSSRSRGTLCAMSRIDVKR